MRSRVVVPELMDDPRLPADVHAHALAGLARLNRWSWSDAGVWKVLHAEAKAVAPRPLHVLDLATGSGDVLIALQGRANRNNVKLELAGCDISETALAIARQNAAGTPIRFFQYDVRRDALPTGYDVIMTSLFLHHLSEADAGAVLQAMAAATTRLVLVNDLHRSRFNLALVRIASQLLTRSHVVHFDGPASVRAAFTADEARDLAIQAGLSNVSIRSQFPCRWLLTWRKPA